MSLRHIAIPSWPAARRPTLPTYALATRVQTALQQAMLAWKASASAPASTTDAAPRPSLISFTPAPTYTLGRRQTEPLSAAELARLKAPLLVSSSLSSSSSPEPASTFVPEVLHAPRGGLATYHGPGQVVLWPVVDLRSPLHARLGVRQYTCVLEQTTIAALRRLFGISGFATANPGVWVRPSPPGGGGGGEERKIAALGVHLRRHVAALGVAVNLGMPVAGPEDANPWARIVACGLHGRGVTSVAAHLGLSAAPSAERVAAVWAEEFAARLGVRGGDGGNVELAVENDDWKAWERKLELDGADDEYVQGQALQT
ncbi:hypothetical protein F4818DRAFT_242458 [Hypoxylon cercidicola]|nr:hypothetical protein F4818DRAFT_242458 [Hypoxylon cercidicola]